MMLDKESPAIQRFLGDRVTWYRPVTLQQLLELKGSHPEANMVVGNTEVGGFFFNFGI